jgi:hypothetical protein
LISNRNEENVLDDEEEEIINYSPLMNILANVSLWVFNEIFYLIGSLI